MKFFSVGAEPVGVIAIGQLPTGVIALGQGATGVVAIGQLARGVFVVGQLAVGVFTFGQVAAGSLWAGGQLAFGGTTSVAMLGVNAIGHWVPWRRTSPQIRPARSRVTLALRVLLFLGLVALTTWLAVWGVIDGLFGDEGVFAPGVTVRR
ncbi:MAG TPA: hypothetical protein VLL51_04595 [Gemmatimonadales bacterium]|nr:hypothetical protein [Gemmatimonadales bacterium]